MGESRCENCRFWDRFDGRGPDVVEEWVRDNPFGVCHRMPPFGPTYLNLSGVTLNAPVQTEPTWWCGEWAPKAPTTADEAAVALARATLAGDLEAGRVLADRVLELDRPAE